MSLLKRHDRRSLGARSLASVLLLLGSVVGASCAQEAITVPVRSLERSGRVSFVCLSAPGTLPGPGRALTDCTRAQSDTPDDYQRDANGVPTLPHLYAMTTQTTRGEVAVVDLTAANDSVIDQDERKPGANFLPIAAQPTDIVSTPKGTATFVAVAEIGRQGIIALPSTMIRPVPDLPVPTLTSWPACALPSAPGAMILVNDPADDAGVTRESCDGPYEASTIMRKVEAECIDGMDITDGSPCLLRSRDLTPEGLGRQKLVVTLPDLGGFVVIDAQQLLDRAAGSFAECPIDRWVPLDDIEVALPGPSSGGGSADGACVDPPAPEPGELVSYAPRPSGIAASGDRLYIGDYEAPVIHAIDMPTPCEPSAAAPLLVSSRDEPSRVVTTSRLATSAGLTSSLRRFLYAIDSEDGSTMVFDITDDGGGRTPLARSNPQWNPFQPVDRIAFGAPARDVIIVERDAPQSHPATGVASAGTLCDPDPSLIKCSVDPQNCDEETLYRTSADYQTGAGPVRLRGMFAFIMLATGAIAVIDIDDYDAACRGPASQHRILGCTPEGLAESRYCNDDGYCVNAVGKVCDIERRRCVECDLDNPCTDSGEVCVADACVRPLETSFEPSCNVVQPHTPRQGRYLLSNESAGRHQPGIQIFPLVTDRNGSAIPIDDPSSPQMRAPIPLEPVALGIAVGGAVEAIDPPGALQDGIIETDDGKKHTLVMNFEDPRAHVSDQLWTVTYEGVIPGFAGKFAELLIDDTDPGIDESNEGLIDPNSRFCDAGVQSQAMVREQLEAEGVPLGTDIDALARARADRVQLVSELPAEDDIHWDGAMCAFQFCETTFGSATVPQPTRDLVVLEAFQDRLVLADSNIAGNGKVEDDALIKCCFPSAVEFRVRGGSQWIVIGDGVGFMHHVIPDPETGQCRNSCDPNDARLNGRVIEQLGDPQSLGSEGESSESERIFEDSPFVFRNPMFRFAITSGLRQVEDEETGQPVIVSSSQRDYQFRFVTQSAFTSLVISLATQTNDIQPQAITFLPSTGELVVTDGQLEGLLLVGLDSLALQRQYF